MTLDGIRGARSRVRDTVLHARLLSVLNGDWQRPLWLKTESLQPAGSVELRGVTSKIGSSLDQAREHGVVTHSSGNHAVRSAMSAADRST